MIQFRSSCGSSALINYLVLRIPCGKVCKFFRVWFADKDYLEPQLAITRPACLLENFVFCEYDIASRLHIRPTYALAADTEAPALRTNDEQVLAKETLPRYNGNM